MLQHNHWNSWHKNELTVTQNLLKMNINWISSDFFFSCAIHIFFIWERNIIQSLKTPLFPILALYLFPLLFRIQQTHLFSISSSESIYFRFSHCIMTWKCMFMWRWRSSCIMAFLNVKFMCDFLGECYLLTFLSSFCQNFWQTFFILEWFCIGCKDWHLCLLKLLKKLLYLLTILRRIKQNHQASMYFIEYQQSQRF